MADKSVMQEALNHIRKELRSRSGKKLEPEAKPASAPAAEPSIAEAIKQPDLVSSKGAEGDTGDTGKQVPTVDVTAADEAHAGIPVAGEKNDFHKKVTEAAIRAMIHGR